MENEAIIERIRKVIREDMECGGECLSPDSRFEQDLGMDSLDRIRFILILEEEFRIVMEETPAEKCATIGELARWIGEKG